MNIKPAFRKNKYKKRDLSISVLRAHLLSLPFLILPAMIIAAFYIIFGHNAFIKGIYNFFSFPEILFILVVGTILHELLHGITWWLFGDIHFKAIKYGFQIKSFTPYVYCRKPIRASSYRTGAMMPGLLLGFVPALIGLAAGDAWVMLFGVLFLSAAGGDFLILIMIKDVDRESLIEDHPDNVGCFIYERDNGD